MKIGALLGPVIDGSDHRFLAEQARRYQAAGYSSLWSAQAVGRGMMLTDPFIALATAATAAPEAEGGVGAGAGAAPPAGAAFGGAGHRLVNDPAGIGGSAAVFGAAEPEGAGALLSLSYFSAQHGQRS